MDTQTLTNLPDRDSADGSGRSRPRGNRLGFLNQPYVWTAAAYALVVLAQWIPVSGRVIESLAAVAATALSYLLATSIGYFTTSLWSGSSTTRWALSFMAGNVLMLVAASVGTWMNLGIVEVLVTLLAVSVGVGLIGPRLGYRGSHRATSRPRLPKVDRRWWWIPVLGTLVAVLYWRWLSPIPFHPTWDGLLHLAATDSILQSFSLDIRDLSNGFQVPAYLPGLHLRLALAETVGMVPTIDMLWAGPFILSALLTVGTFRLLRGLDVPGPMASSLALLPTFLQFLQKSTSPLAQLTPASELTALAPFLVLIAIEGTGPWVRPRLAAFAGLLLVLPLHAVGASLLIAVLGAALLWVRLFRERPWIEFMLACAGTAAVLIVLTTAPFLVPQAVLDPTGTYSEFVPDSSVEERIAAIPTWANVWLLRLGIIGATVALFRRRDQATSPQALGAVIALGLTFGFFAPIAGFERMHAFVGLAVAMGLGLGLRRVSRRLVDRPGRLLAFASVVGLGVVVLLPWMAEPLLAHREKQIVDTDIDIASSFADFEVEFWSGESGSVFPELPVVSDPIGQSIAEAFGHRVTINGPYLPDVVQSELLEVLRSDSPSDIRRRLGVIQAELGSPYLLALSGRSYWWAYGRAGTFDFAFRPRLLSAMPNDRVDFSSAAHLASFPHCTELAAYSTELVVLRVDCREA